MAPECQRSAAAMVGACLLACLTTLEVIAGDNRPMCDDLPSHLEPWRVAIAKVRQATVRVWCDIDATALAVPLTFESLEPIATVGGGALFVSNDTVITVRHNFLDGPRFEETYARKEACVVEDSLGKFHRIKDIHFRHRERKYGDDFTTDVAVLELASTSAELTPLSLSKDTLNLVDGQEIGHLATVVGYSPSERNYSCRAQVSRIEYLTQGNEYTNGSFQFHGFIGEGNSGSAVFDRSGDFVGMVLGDSSSTRDGPREPLVVSAGALIIHWKDQKRGLKGNNGPLYPQQ
ncbi:trypsin-like peptidase domain-containing protein [Rhizobium laguerreae]|uniref:S1 family peptidase n=1 Tax=Rhizobium laguerreae TaxID=1076926 RepID=UPI001C8FD916|nr:serine protease [Rhizobium laguerreae]MBY3258450.1 trypsin-like peptidase domain-containing protein [Rhizobium laguerreae]MBY3286437.1 trypsin-like peptidase domain-containing protein [Rhizobium laguerreae]MBY3293100.1 trypsin-like peptidase domain-containing protein [Rhizobium laguerreae]